jgi:hypothetical protein
MLQRTLAGRRACIQRAPSPVVPALFAKPAIAEMVVKKIV